MTNKQFQPKTWRFVFSKVVYCFGDFKEWSSRRGGPCIFKNPPPPPTHTQVLAFWFSSCKIHVTVSAGVWFWLWILLVGKASYGNITLFCIVYNNEISVFKHAGWTRKIKWLTDVASQKLYCRVTRHSNQSGVFDHGSSLQWKLMGS